LKNLIAITLFTALLTASYSGAETITLPADPPAKRTIELVEQWRLGDDEEDVLLGVISFAAIDEAGQVYLVDRQLSQVLVVGPDGELITILGREGEGPGELNQPHAMILLDEGAVGVVQGFPGRIIGIKSDGTPAGDITLGGGAEEGGFSFVRECLRVGDHLIANTGRMVFDMGTGKAKRTKTLAVYNMQGTLITSLAEHAMDSDLTRQVFDEVGNFSEMNIWTPGAQGLVYTTPSHEEYKVSVRQLTGETLRTIQRPFTPRKRTQAEKDAMTDGIRMVMDGQRIEVENKALDTDQAIRDLAVADDGRLFITNCYQQRTHLPEGTAAQYDVVSTTGEFIEELTLLVPEFDGDQDVLFFMDGQHFVVLKNFESASTAMDSQGGGSGDDNEEEAEPFAVIFMTMP